MDVYKNLREGEKGAWISIFTYIFLSGLKLTVGLIGTSEALKADGLNNTTDIIASVAVLVGLRISQRPPDKDHHYGHLRAETVSSLIASFIMAVVGLQVVFNAIKKFTTGEHQEPSLMTAIVAVVCGVIMYIVYMYNIRLATRIKSSAVKAAAYDNRSDALVSFGTAIGILAAIFGFPVIDSITAVLVGLLIIKTAYDIFVEAVHTLTDGFDEDELVEIEALVRHVTGVIDVRDMKGRMSGNMMFLDVTITVDAKMDVVQSHHITELIESTVREYNPYAVTLVHIEPAEYATI
ncbi:cation diffusion facilitator family transporter [Kurthia massiliensis]|uniref:cation diffusion facilitator family transporter n=1 Tax=Kurthia massiliensis TaxID=1033739 RepID=UPI0002880E2D|nr:cation diffusion facilitator family transporter [Kurthia massiliensis]